MFPKIINYLKIAHANDVIYLRDGSPLFGEEVREGKGAQKMGKFISFFMIFFN